MNFNQKAHRWETISLSQKQAADDLLNMITINEDDHILDVGCGTGYLTEKLYKISKNTSGMDYSKNMIKVAKSIRPDINFYVDNAEDLKIENQLDLIVTNAVTYYFKNIPETFKKFHTALKHNGCYALQSQVIRTLQFSNAFKKLEEDPETRNIFTTFKLPTTILSREELIKTLQEQNFYIQDNKLIEYQTEYTVEQAVDVFTSGAATQYLNQNAYSQPLTEKYINSFWRVIKTSLKEQSQHNKITLDFIRCFILAKKC